jgi:hypothetical protein
MDDEITFPIGLDDAELLQFSYQNNQLDIVLKLWNGKKLFIKFKHVILFFALDHLDIKALYCKKEGKFLELALSRAYVKVPDNHEYKLFQFYDIEDDPVLEIVAREFEHSIE